VAASADVANELASKPTAIMVNVDFKVVLPNMKLMHSTFGARDLNMNHAP
jgi:hypothetical protein